MGTLASGQPLGVSLGIIFGLGGIALNALPPPKAFLRNVGFVCYVGMAIALLVGLPTIVGAVLGAAFVVGRERRPPSNHSSVIHRPG